MLYIEREKKKELEEIGDPEAEVLGCDMCA